MLEWLIGNLSTIVITLVLVVICELSPQVQ